MSPMLASGLAGMFTPHAALFLLHGVPKWHPWKKRGWDLNLSLPPLDGEIQQPTKGWCWQRIRGGGKRCAGQWRRGKTFSHHLWGQTSNRKNENRESDGAWLPINYKRNNQLKDSVGGGGGGGGVRDKMQMRQNIWGEGFNVAWGGKLDDKKWRKCNIMVLSGCQMTNKNTKKQPKSRGRNGAVTGYEVRPVGARGEREFIVLGQSSWGIV